MSKIDDDNIVEIAKQTYAIARGNCSDTYLSDLFQYTWNDLPDEIRDFYCQLTLAGYKASFQVLLLELGIEGSIWRKNSRKNF